MCAGRLVAIHLCAAKGAPPVAVPRVRALAAAGLEGDRHHPQPASDAGAYEVSLIAAEALADLEAQGLGLAPGAHRRQLTVTGVDLAALEGRGGLYARILVGGELEVGAPVALEA